MADNGFDVKSTLWLNIQGFLYKVLQGFLKLGMVYLSLETNEFGYMVYIISFRFRNTS